LAVHQAVMNDPPSVYYDTGEEVEERQLHLHRR